MSDKTLDDILGINDENSSAPVEPTDDIQPVEPAEPDASGNDSETKKSDETKPKRGRRSNKEKELEDQKSNEETQQTTSDETQLDDVGKAAENKNSAPAVNEDENENSNDDNLNNENLQSNENENENEDLQNNEGQSNDESNDDVSNDLGLHTSDELKPNNSDDEVENTYQPTTKDNESKPCSSYPLRIKLRIPTPIYRGPSLSFRGASFGGTVEVLGEPDSNNFAPVQFVRPGFGKCKGYIRLSKEAIAKCQY